MSIMSRWFAPVLLVAGLGLAALAPAPAHAQSNDLARVIVDVADVIFRDGSPYYRQGQYRHDDRLIVVRDRYGRPTYYRQVSHDHRSGPPYGKAYGYYRNGPGSRHMKCNKHGKCKATGKYRDSRYSYDRRDRDDDRRYDRRDRDDRRYYGRRDD